MAFINIAEWTAVNTTDWLKGLDDCILPYVQFFLNNNINGCRLLLLSCDDLNNLNVCKVGHQELILEGVDLLKHLHYNFGSETLQSLALRLGCRARSLYNQLKQNHFAVNNNNHNEDNHILDHNSDERVSTPTLSAVTDILAAVKAFISWIDRYPFEGQDQYIPVRKTILKLSIELASTAQRDQFVEKPNEIIESSCITLAELCDRIVQELNDSLAIQPAVLDIVTVKKKPEEELGMHIHSSYSGIHIVGGIKFQSPSHRCGRIEEGDEIVQVTYQTVVGWQLKKLVNSMKEHPTEIVLTIKKRPRHTNLIGQVIVLKPYKIPNRKANRQNGNRLKNAATTTVGSDGDDDAFLPNDNKSGSKPVYQLYPRKPKLPVRRRATISGSSPTVGQPPIRIEDLVQNMNKKETFNRSISHESPPNHMIPNRNRGLSVPSEVPTNLVPLNQNNNNNKINVNNNNNIINAINNNNILNNSSNNCNNSALNTGNKSLVSHSPALPYAKVHPFPNEDPINKRGENETYPKKIVPSKECNYPKMNQNDSISESELKPHEEVLKTLENKRLGIALPPTQVGVVNPSPVTVMSYQLISDIQPKSALNEKQTKEEKINSLSKSPLLMRRKMKETSNVDNNDRCSEKQSPLNQPIMRSDSKLRHSTRRVSVRDLGEGDCDGWLYQRKERQRLLGHSCRWTKRWVVLKNNYLYCYKNQKEEKAECLIHLPGFTVAPALECKSKKHAFKLFNPSTAFHFATDSQSDMSSWMSKMGLAAISYMTQSDLLPEAFCYSETDDSEEGFSPTYERHPNKYKFSSKPISYREKSPAAHSTSSSDTNNSIREELYGRSRITSSSSTSTSNSSTFQDIRPKLKSSNKISQNSPQSYSTGRPSLIPNSPLIQHRTGYVRSASSLEANDMITVRNRRQLLSDSSNTRYAKIVFPQSQSLKGSFSPQIPPRRLKVPLSPTTDSGSLDRQRLNFLKNITSGTVSKITDSYNNLQENIDTPIENNTRQIQPPRPLPRKSINRREKVEPNFVTKMTESYDQMSKPSDPRILPIPNTPPTRPAVPKPSDKFNALNRTESKNEANIDDTYEYVFRPTMAMIKTGIVNPLYERVPNSTWSGDCRSNSTGKSRMPLPNEMIQQPIQRNMSKELKSNNEKQSPNELSILDREYNRLYGNKKPNERLSPKIMPFIPKSASTAEIENIYTSKPRTTSSSSIGHFDDSSPQLTPYGGRERPNTPSSSDNSMSSSSGISSYYSTYLEIPAEHMNRIKNNRRQTSTSSYHSTKSSPPPSADFHQNRKIFDFSDKSIEQQKMSNEPNIEENNENNSKGNKSPQKSSSFRLFSSPKLLKKLSTPKYQKERHLEKKDFSNKLTPFEDNTKQTTVTKTSRLFLGSPKLTRALFGSSSKKSPPNELKIPQKSNENSPSIHLDNCIPKVDDSKSILNRSSSDSSVQSTNTGGQHKSNHIIEKKLTKPELTIQLPLVTESSTDSSELPLTPETPRKPTMGIAMIGKKRRPSNVSSDRVDIETALNQYYGQTTNSSISSRSPYTTDTDDEWASIVRTIEVAGRTLDSDRKAKVEVNRPNTSGLKQIDDDKLCQIVLNLRAVQRRLKPEQHKEFNAIEELLNQSINTEIFEAWLKRYPNLLPQEF